MQGRSDELPDGRYLQTERWRLYYHAVGEGPPVVLLHGSGPGSTAWSTFKPTIPSLARRNRVIALDLPGWGRSDPIDPMTEYVNLAHVEAVRLLLDKLGIARASLLGNSMGGHVATQFALEYPERVDRLIAMGSGIMAGPATEDLMGPGGLTEGLRAILQTYEEPSPSNFRRMVNVIAYDDAFGTESLYSERSGEAQATPMHLENFLKPFRAGLGYSRPSPASDVSINRFARMMTPCLFIHGRNDRVVHMEKSLRAVAVIPNSTLHLFNRCGHWPHIEHAAAFNAVVSMFLSPADEPTIDGGFGG